MGGALGGTATITRSWRLDDLIADGHDPLMLEELDGARPFPGVPSKASLEEIDTLRAQLVRARQLGRVALSNVVHNSPFVVKIRPRSATGCHLENDAAQRPHIDSPGAAWVFALDHFGRHVHWCTCHRVVWPRCCRNSVNHGTALPCENLCCTKVDVLDDTVVVKEDV